MGARGTKDEPLIAWEQILEATHGGYDVFRHEIGKFPTGKAFSHPLKKDRDPSGSMVCRNGVWFLCDFAKTYPTMTALQFIQKKYALNYRGAVDKMAIDFGLKKMAGEYVPVEIKWEEPVGREECTIHIGFSGRKWKKEQHEFWKGTEVDEAHCKKYETYAVKDLAINRRRVAIKDGEVVWAYYADDIDRVKIYFPERPKRDRFKTNVPGNYLWNIKNIGACDKLVVQKSNKDMLCTLVMFPCVIATMSENAGLFTEEVVETIHGLSKKIWVAYGSDQQGVDQSTQLSEKYKWKWVNPPAKLLPDINDCYSLERAQGIEAWRECLTKKGIL